jgi:hypothetical protein
MLQLMRASSIHGAPQHAVSTTCILSAGASAEASSIQHYPEMAEFPRRDLIAHDCCAKCSKVGLLTMGQRGPRCLPAEPVH